MHVYVEFALSMVWAQMIALAMRRLIWDEMSFSMVFLSGVMGGLPGWFLGAMLATQFAWFANVSYECRLLVIGGLVVIFVAGVQRNLSKEGN